MRPSTLTAEITLLVRKDGTHTAFVHFSNATPKGYTGSALYASIGITSSGDGVNSASSGRFAGLRSFRYATGYNHYCCSRPDRNLW
ncbi:Phage infection protein [Streptococcus pyogenes]|nr:Phage infection protein [Streptococcus pyogenes]